MKASYAEALQKLKETKSQKAPKQTRTQSKTSHILDFSHNISDYVQYLAFQSEKTDDLHRHWEVHLKGLDYISLDSKTYEAFLDYKRQSQISNIASFFRLTGRFIVFSKCFCTRQPLGFNTYGVIQKKLFHKNGEKMQ